MEQTKPEPRTQDEPDALKAAVRRARVEQAERSEVVAELRGAEIARLEILFEAFKPVLAQVPAELELFDAGITQGERPRLFIDMIAFVEMAHDRRVFSFIQETRHGRVALAQGERIEPIVDAMTDYVARRLVERQLALAADRTPLPVKETPAPQLFPVAQQAAAKTDALAKTAALPQTEVPAKRRSAFATGLLFTIELLGSITLFVLLAGAAYLAWRAGEAWWVTRFAQLD